MRDAEKVMLKGAALCGAFFLWAGAALANGPLDEAALAADVVIASKSAFFMQAFTRIGLMPDAGGTWLLPRQKSYPIPSGS